MLCDWDGGRERGGRRRRGGEGSGGGEVGGDKGVDRLIVNEDHGATKLLLICTGGRRGREGFGGRPLVERNKRGRREGGGEGVRVYKLCL